MEKAFQNSFEPNQSYTIRHTKVNIIANEVLQTVGTLNCYDRTYRQTKLFTRLWSNKNISSAQTSAAWDNTPDSCPVGN